MAEPNRLLWLICLLVCTLRTETLRFPYYATCVAGFEHVLAKELRDLCGARKVQTTGSSGVEFDGGQEVALRALMHCRTALRIMERLAETDVWEVSNRDDLYAFVGSIDWDEYLPPEGTLKVDTSLGLEVPKGL